MQLVLFVSVLLLLLQLTFATDNAPLNLDRFAAYAVENPNQCFVCDNIMAPRTTARGKQIFTCSHGDLVHKRCALRMFNALDEDKKCPHVDCGHAPLIHPLLSDFSRIQFNEVYRTLTGPTPGLCTSCQEPLYREYGLRALRLREMMLSKCANGVHYYHQGCAESVMHCECGSSLFEMRVALRGSFDIPAMEQYSRLDSFYEGLLPQVERVHVEGADVHVVRAGDRRRHAGRFVRPSTADSPVVHGVRPGDPRRHGRQFISPPRIVGFPVRVNDGGESWRHDGPFGPLPVANSPVVVGVHAGDPQSLDGRVAQPIPDLRETDSEDEPYVPVRAGDSRRNAGRFE